jgi:phytoene dehydrogenase-like protein
VEQNTRKIVIIGGGIAGLSAGVYARRCGYRTDVFEMNETPGGLATSWHRGDYRFETCLHWLLGSNPSSPMYSQWQEVFDIGKLTFVNPEEYIRLETEHGESLPIYTNVDRMEKELLNRAPQDTIEIRHFASAIRTLARLPIPDPTEPWLTLLHTLPVWPLLRQLSNISIEQYGQRFKHYLLRALFGGGGQAKLSALALLFSLAWMSERNAGYALGGSQAIIRLIADNFRSLGGNLRLGAKVAKILVERDTAVGVELASGERIAADWVASAADGHATIYDLLGSKYTDSTIDKIYRTYETFPSYLQISLGVARNLSQRPGFMARLLDAPLEIDPGTQLSQVSFRFFHFDPTFAPYGKTPVTCFLPTRNFEYWTGLHQNDAQRYQAEKHRVAEAVIEILERIVPDVRPAIEVIDVSTPATVIRYTGNWKGSMEGWLLTPGSGFKPLRQTLPGLRRFLMAGQWIMPGGGLPAGLWTARSAIQAACKRDRMRFIAHAGAEQQRVPAQTGG